MEHSRCETPATSSKPTGFTNVLEMFPLHPLDKLPIRYPHEKVTAESFEKDGVPIGEGTYGTVWRARRKGDTGNALFAMKKVVLRNEREGLPLTAIREIRALRRLDHPNVVKMVSVCTAAPEVGIDVREIYLVFEYLNSDLTGLLAWRKGKLKTPEVKCLMHQMMCGLDYCHTQNILHRDLKPSNILVTNSGQLKLCDFGLSRTFSGFGNYSTRVITLWYRPPELLLGARTYDAGVDIWSAGCIFGEMLEGAPLFADSAEIKVFHKIVDRCGRMNETDWPDHMRHSLWERFWPHQRQRDTFKRRIDLFADTRTKRGNGAADLLIAMLGMDPHQRITSEETLKHPYFSEAPLACRPEDVKISSQLSLHELDVKRHREKLRDDNEREPSKDSVKEPGRDAQTKRQGDSNGDAAESSAKRPRFG